MGVGFNCCGVQLSGKCAQTQSVTKLIASWLMKLRVRTPPGFEANVTLGSKHGERRDAAVWGVSVGVVRRGATVPGNVVAC